MGSTLIQFGSPGWFEQLPLPNQVPSNPSFIVEYRVAETGEGAETHQQIFDDKGLVAWVPGQPMKQPDLVLEQDAQTNAGDLLGRTSPTDNALGTSILVNGKHTDMLGLRAVQRPELEQHTVGTVDIGIAALNTPFGDVEAVIRLYADGTQAIVQKQDADCQATLTTDWSNLLDLVHINVLMGPLIGNNLVQVDGSLTVVSYAVGHLCWPKTTQDTLWSTQFHKTLATYRQYRASTEFLALMDWIEENTS